MDLQAKLQPSRFKTEGGDMATDAQNFISP